MTSISAEEIFRNLEELAATINAQLEWMRDARSAVVVAQIEADEAALAIEEHVIQWAAEVAVEIEEAKR